MIQGKIIRVAGPVVDVQFTENRAEAERCRAGFFQRPFSGTGS